MIVSWPWPPGASVTGVNAGAFGSTVSAQRSPVEELASRSKPRVCATSAVDTVPFGAGPVNGPIGSGVIDHSPGVATRDA